MLLDVIYRESFILNKQSKNHFVDINEIFDGDETFLFKNDSFRSLIQRVTLRYDNCVSQAYDLSSIREELNPKYEEYFKDKSDEEIDANTLTNLQYKVFEVQGWRLKDEFK